MRESRGAMRVQHTQHTGMWSRLILLGLSLLTLGASLTVYVQPSLTCQEGGTADLLSIRVGDTQSPTTKLQVNISVTHGQLYLPHRAGLYLQQGKVGADARFEIIGVLSDVQRALSSIKYLADADYVGADAIQLSVSGVSGVSGGVTAVQASCEVDIEAVNDPPVLTLSAQFLLCDQGSSASLTGTVTDTEAGTDTEDSEADEHYTMRVTALHGAVAVGGCTAGGGGGCLLQGLGSINSALQAGVVYSPPSTSPSPTQDAVTITVSDGGQGGGGNLTVTTVVPVIVRRVAVAPTITTPKALAAEEDTLLSLASLLGGVGLTAQVRVDYAVQWGGLVQLSGAQLAPFRQQLHLYQSQLQQRYSDAFPLPPSPYDRAGKSLQFGGSEAAVEAAMRSVYYLPLPDWVGTDTLTLSAANPALNTTTTTSVLIAVAPVDDPPSVTVWESDVWTAEDTPLALPRFSFADADLPMDSVLHVTVQADRGLLSVTPSAASLKVRFLDSTGPPSTGARLALIGSPADLNALFHGQVVYTPPKGGNFNTGAASGVIRVAVAPFDVVAGVIVSTPTAPMEAFVSVYVTPVNQAPVVTAPTLVYTWEDTSLPLPISVTDADWAQVPGDKLRATLTVTFGSVSLDQALMRRLGQYFGDNTDRTVPLWASSLSDLNLLLSNVTYHPLKDWSGDDFLTVTVCDGDPLSPLTASSTAHTTIQVSAVNDPPYLVAPSFLVTPMGTMYALVVGVTDVDLESADPKAALTVTLSTGLDAGAGMAAGMGGGSLTLRSQEVKWDVGISGQARLPSQAGRTST
ncbi:hypothetical protein B484DRAFT_57752 [Ochromonadaceae sp. CCMP2298]|nr:hypothetical protein B484DRAFT_57752 [Ochromonadaceae sp. CCMP2298]